MGSSRDRVIIFPSRANLNFIKAKYASTERGYNLLKRKKDSLMLRQRALISEIINERQDLPQIMQNAIYSFNRAKFLAVDINTIGLYASSKSEIHVIIKYNIIVGVTIPTFKVEIIQDSISNSYPLAGLGKGGQQLLDIRNKFQEVTIKLVELAAKVFANKRIIEAVKQTNKRVNALEYLVLPKLRTTQHYITDELDELEREEFFRLKKAKAQKTKNNLYAENLKTDQDLNIKHVLYSAIEPEEFIRIRQTLKETEKLSIRALLNKNIALEKV